VKENGQVAGSIKPSEALRAAEAVEVAPAAPTTDKPKVLPAHQRFANWVRINVCNWLGITYAMQQLNMRGGGIRADVDALAESAVKNAELLKRVVEQLNAHTHIITAWENGYPILHKIANEMRTREAKKAGKIALNGSGAGLGLVGADGTTPLKSEPQPEPVNIKQTRRDRLVEEIARNFEASMAGREQLHATDDGGGTPTVVSFLGDPLTDEEVALVKSEQKRLLDALRK
jgi:hypothetical protein